MRRMWLAVIVFFIVTAVGAATRSHFIGSLSPALQESVVFSVSKVDLRANSPAVEATCTVDIVNKSGKPTKYTVKTTCGCTSLSPRAGELAAGAKQSIAVSIRSPQSRGATQTVALLLLLNDEDRVRGHCDIRVLCPSVIDISPTTLALRKRVDGSLTPADFQIGAIDGGSWVSDVVVNSSSDLFKVNAIDSTGGKRGFRVSVSDADDVSGDRFGTLSVLSSQGELLAVIPMRLQCDQSATAIPSRLNVSKSSSGASVLHIRYGDMKPAATIGLVNGPKGLTCTDEGFISSKLRRLRMQWSEELDVSTSSVVLKIGQDGETCVCKLD